jgi:FkbM family methyltransferase
MIHFLKRLASLLPLQHQHELKRLNYGWQIRRRTFGTDEREFHRLHEWVSAGDWVLDVGANVGHYTLRLSELVSKAGRVLAFEPVPDTFSLLAANVARLPIRNVTLLNVAASDKTTVLGMSIPRFETGLRNYYQAALNEGAPDLPVLCLAIGCLNIPQRVQLAKVDVEGHELSVLKGMANILERDHPVLIVEGRSTDVASYLGAFGYVFEEADGSPNRVFTVRPRIGVGAK